MDVIVTLLILFFFLLVPLLPALFMMLIRKAGGTKVQEPRPPSLPERPWPERPLWPPPRRAVEVRREPPRYEVLVPPISRDIIARRPLALEEIVPSTEVSLDEIPAHPPAVAPVVEVQARRRPAYVHRPFDVRRAVVLGALLGPPRAQDPWGG